MSDHRVAAKAAKTLALGLVRVLHWAPLYGSEDAKSPSMENAVALLSDGIEEALMYLAEAARGETV